MKLFLRIFCLSLLPLVSGCIFNFSPSYTPPELTSPIPGAYKEEQGWKTAVPADDVAKGEWWRLFKDDTLNALMEKANIANQNIARAAANLRNARAQVSSARSAFFPRVSLPGSYTRRGQENAPTTSQYTVGLNAQWEINFWNSLPAFEAAKAEAEATAADYATMRLSTQAELAQTYFQLRTLDEQIRLYESTIAAYDKALQLTRSQYHGGVVTSADVAQAESKLASAEAEHFVLQRQRAELEHGIAILLGLLPSSFSLEKSEFTATLPYIPEELPSSLLERRPDIAAAERRVASANQQIGIARGAWFPSFSLSASRTLQGTSWITAPITVWSLGPQAALSLFEGGKRFADSDAAQAHYEATVASYRQTALQGFKEVEDNLSSLEFMEHEAKARQRAVTAAQMTLRLALSQYREGMTTYLQVVTAQTTALTNESSAIQLQGQRFITSVSLIKALGGSWNKEKLLELTAGEEPWEGTLVR